VQPVVRRMRCGPFSMTRTISGSNKAAMADLIGKHNIEVCDHGIHFAPDVGYTVTAFATSEEIRGLRLHGYRVVQHEDADELGKARQREVGAGNRYARYVQHGSPPSSTRGTTYLNVDEVESALAAAAAAPYAGIAKLIALPKPTWEGRQCHALRTGSQSGAGRTCVYFLGGIHAREWGSCDILIKFHRTDRARLRQRDRSYVRWQDI
jgi:zinc carboxypeptidase